MAHVVGIVGKSGAGKSTGAKFLNPKTTLYINCDRKPLPFKNWSKDYNSENGNYMEISKQLIINKILKQLNVGKTEKGVDISQYKRVIIDTGNAVMVDDEMRRMHEKGFDKWQDLAAAVYDIVNNCQELRKELVVYIMFHEESYLDDDNVRTTRILTNGKKLNKINLATRLTTILWAKSEKIDDGKNEHYYETKFNNNEAKSPDGMFDEFKIPNDLALVEKAIREYDGTQIPDEQILRPELLTPKK